MFWKEMAIFVIEQDAQSGPDHLYAHRTVGFVISPRVADRFGGCCVARRSTMLANRLPPHALPPPEISRNAPPPYL
jgi:hypothetical protein